MSEDSPPAIPPASKNGGCGTLAIALIALFVALGAGNQARSKANRIGNQLQNTRGDVSRLETTVRELKAKIGALEERIGELEKR